MQANRQGDSRPKWPHGVTISQTQIERGLVHNIKEDRRPYYTIGVCIRCYIMGVCWNMVMHLLHTCLAVDLAVAFRL